MRTIDAEAVAKLEAHLRECGFSDIRVGTIKINRVEYVAARYGQDSQERIYCVGERPACLRRRSHTAFNFDGDTRDWYNAAYMPQNRITPQHSAYHPCGANFLLSAWTVPNGEKIDAHNYWRGEHKPYSRVKAQFSLIA